MFTSDQKGAIAEAAVTCAALKRGVAVLKPVAEGGRYDLVFDLGGKFVCVQCKWASRRGEVVIVPCYSARRARTGLVRRLYTSHEIDAYAAYGAALDRCYLLPVERFPGRSAIQLRLSPARNKQQVGINWQRSSNSVATLATTKALGP